FLRAARGYDCVVAVGDTYALAMSLLPGAPVLFVGTAKSIAVAPYGPFEERVLRRARAIFVRDEPTAVRLREHGLCVEPAANVIVDLFATQSDGSAAAIAQFDPALVLLPGSRENAYDDARFLLRIAQGVASELPQAGAVLSVAPGLDAGRFAREASSAGWTLGAAEREEIPFVLALGGRVCVRAWRGSLGGALAGAGLALGQAGTANEAAAAAGVPVVAFELGKDRKTAWYRKRQQGLLGEALAILPGDERALAGVLALLRDPQRRAAMGATGRARMGERGAARRIARRLLALGSAA
ncbi:MAG TPA: hypothetical protein VMH02_07285, partial [Verrucomicrobiae bacterium]|nr:hypothetical protein [Verrucomicrobiae bacterium]